jgi:beta-phosphoglucomutase
VKALLLDFNGTLLNDEPIMCRIFQDLFAEAGKPLSDEEYYAELAGLSDPEIVERWLGEPRPDLLKRKVEAYKRAVYMAELVGPAERSSLREAAHRVKLGIVSGASREEIEAVLNEMKLLARMSVIIAAEDVTHGKPHPEGYRRALHALRVDAGEAVAVEDSDVGVAAAKGAGLYCVAVTTTMPAERLSAADRLVHQFDYELIDELVSFA